MSYLFNAEICFLVLVDFEARHLLLSSVNYFSKNVLKSLAFPLKSVINYFHEKGEVYDFFYNLNTFLTFLNTFSD